MIEQVPNRTAARPWYIWSGEMYKKIRISVSLLFILMVLVTLFIQSGLAGGTLRDLGMSLSLLGNPALSSDVNTAAHLGDTANVPESASQRLVRISQLDPNQYSSQQEWNTWAYSACSAASMTEVFNAYGMHLRITDVLQVEARIGEITPQLGLLRPEGIVNTAAQFGFKTTWSKSYSLDQVISIANSGTPVIVDFPPYLYSGGHILVVIGGDSTSVYLADSSLWNHRHVSRGQFMGWWDGTGWVVTPK